MFVPFLILLLVIATFVAVGSVIFYRVCNKRNTTLSAEITRLEERNESLDRQNQLMERQYKLFSMKPVMTLLSDEQFASLARVVSSTILAITKQTN